MDFELDEDQLAVGRLAADILRRTCGFDDRRGPGADPDRCASQAWRAFIEADLAGLTLPERIGGSGRGLVDAAAICVELGRAAVWVPYVNCIVSTAMPIVEHGSAEQIARWLPDILSHTSIITAALAEPSGDPRRPTLLAARQGTGWRLDGVREAVPDVASAAMVLVPATTPDGAVVLFLVPTGAPGVAVQPQRTTAARPTGRLVFDGVRLEQIDVLAGPETGRAALDRIVDATTICVAAQMAGLAAATVDLTAGYVTTRHQFGRPIATFQAVSHRLADAFIDTRAMMLTMWQAAWRHEEAAPARRELAIAKFWAAEGGQRIVHTAQHLHGGIGVDRDYPLHAYFLMAKELELYLGGASRQLEAIADALVAGDRPRPETTTLTA